MSLPYLPARIVESNSRWYIVYYQTNPVSGKRERYRETCDLNRIKSKRNRIQMAQTMINQINKKLPHGYPYEAFVGLNQLFMDALDEAVKIKCRMSDRKESHFAYSGIITIVKAFFQHYNLKNVTIDQFDDHMADKFLKWAIMVRGVSNVTRNNYLIRTKSLLNEVIHDKSDNPFKGIRSLKPQSKKRRALDETETRLIIDKAALKDVNLTLAIMLIFHCFIRPAEQLRLRIGHFDIRNRRINLTSEITKNKKASSVIIPDPMMPFLHKLNLHEYSKRDFLFGRAGCPGPVVIGKRRMAIYHDQIVDELDEQGKITDSAGLTLYSWKDTGVIALLNAGVNVRDIQRQLRHHSLDMTEKYLNGLAFISDQIQVGNDLLKGRIPQLDHWGQ